MNWRIRGGDADPIENPKNMRLRLEEMWRIKSEFGFLRKVMVFNVGYNRQNLNIPFKGIHPLLWTGTKNVLDEKSQSQYNNFLGVLRSKGTEILELNLIIEKIVEHASIKEKKKYVSRLWGRTKPRPLPDELDASAILFGFRPKEIDGRKRNKFTLPLKSRANMYVRDIGFNSQNGFFVGRMRNKAKRKQNTLLRFVLENYDSFKRNLEFVWDASQDIAKPDFHVECGDILIIDEEMIACGIGQQTDYPGFCRLVKRLFQSNEKLKTICGVYLPTTPASNFMHLDTTISFIDDRKCLLMPYVYSSSKVDLPCKKTLYRLLDETNSIIQKENGERRGLPSAANFSDSGKCLVCKRKREKHPEARGHGSFLDFLISESLLEKDGIILVGGRPSKENDFDHLLRSIREQSTQGANVVAIRPSEVVIYERNQSTIRDLEEHGVRVTAIPDSYLDLNGGPHCLTLPLERDE
jgi:arginine deiminase